ncbi:MAG TPA: putative sugar nucleotidyl transferase [Tepidisphaeraceae bacterium]|nr:putative sugar nucleotidyl transferase [Tepidisphaeraceae bacterium]
MHVVVFEGSNWRGFAPLSLSRPVFALASGTGLLIERQLRHLRPSRVTLWCRAGLADWVMAEIAPRVRAEAGCEVAVNRPLEDEPALLIDGGTTTFSAGEPVEGEGVIAAGGAVRRAVVREAGLSSGDALEDTARWRAILGLPKLPGEVRSADWAWELVAHNQAALAEDYAGLFAGRAGDRRPEGHYHVVNAERVWFGAAVAVEPGVVLDASRGPVMLADGCSVGANSVIKGPAYVGPHCQVKPMSVIHAGTSLGPVCKVGGEIGNSILTGYSNKAHEGYLGDSYLGEWVNLGAGTITSNLKNTYGQIKIRVGSRELPTGMRHLGSLIGDHAKTAIGTRLMTGSYVGYSSMIAASGLPPTFVPSLSFVTDRGREGYRMEKAVEVMRAVYARRQRGWSAVEEGRVRYVAGAVGEVEG